MAAGDRMFRVSNVEIQKGQSVRVYYKQRIAQKDVLEQVATTKNFEILWDDFQKLLTTGEKSALSRIIAKLGGQVKLNDETLANATKE